MVGQALQHVADVDHDGVGVGGEVDPLALARQHLQAGRAGAHQQGDEVDVLVRAGTHVRHVGVGDFRVVDRAQDGVAVVGLVGEVVFRQLDVQGQRRQHFRAERVERGVQAVQVLLELRHLRRPQVLAHDAGVFGIARDFAADVPELLQVRVFRVLGGLDAERRVAARAAGARLVVFHLDVFRQREEGLGGVVGALDQLVGDAVAADAAEAPLAVGGAQFGHEGGAVGIETADVEGRDLAHGAGSGEFRAQV